MRTGIRFMYHGQLKSMDVFFSAYHGPVHPFISALCMQLHDTLGVLTACTLTSSVYHLHHTPRAKLSEEELGSLTELPLLVPFRVQEALAEL